MLKAGGFYFMPTSYVVFFDVGDVLFWTIHYSFLCQTFSCGGVGGSIYADNLFLILAVLFLT